MRLLDNLNIKNSDKYKIIIERLNNGKGISEDEFKFLLTYKTYAKNMSE